LVRNSKQNSVFVNFTPAVSKAALKSMRAETRKWNFRNRPDLELKDIANMYNPLLRGWIGYYERYHPTALGSFLGHFNLTLRAWAMNKYKKLRGKKTRATHFLQGIAEREPRLFVHWRKDMALRFA
jgi:RNA-directed DNA polymerase